MQRHIASLCICILFLLGLESPTKFSVSEAVIFTGYHPPTPCCSRLRDVQVRGSTQNRPHQAATFGPARRNKTECVLLVSRHSLQEPKPCPRQSRFSVITQCSIHELYTQGKDQQLAVDLAKLFERRKCNHREAIPGDDCLQSVVGSSWNHPLRHGPQLEFFFRGDEQTSIRDCNSIPTPPRQASRHTRNTYRPHKSFSDRP